ncbi:MAG: DNA translocase FtsK 4TM domain-containing protein [Candidatus Promineifilaceae bacterium]
MARKSSGSKTKQTSSSRKRSSSSSRKSSTKSADSGLNTPQKALIIGVSTIFVAAIFALSLFAPNQGQLTAWLSDMMRQAMGWGAYLIPLIAAGIGLYLVLWGMEQPPRVPIYRLLGGGVLLIVFVAFASMVFFMRQEGMADYWEVARAQQGGGYFGGLVATGLTQSVGNLGAIFVLVVFGFVGAILVSGLNRHDMSRYLKALLVEEEVDTSGEAAPRPDIRVNPGRSQRSQAVQLKLVPDEDNSKNTAAKSTPTSSKQPAKKERSRISLRKKKEYKQAKPRSAPVRETAVTSSGSADSGMTWVLPMVSEILEAGTDLDVNNAVIREQVEIIEHTLESFGAPATVVEINQGPTVTQFGVEPNYIQMRSGRQTKVKVGKIAGLADDLALALAAKSIRIQAPVPGKSYVGIEVPNPSKTLVSLRDVIESPNYRQIRGTLGLGLGQNVSGESIVADLATMPHLLIAGTTGSGKSVCVNSIIACLLLKNTPDDLKVVMIDPKRVELTGYNGIPHLAAPVVVEMDRVISTLQWALREMDRRYEAFAAVKARHIDEYNKKISRRRDAQKMPYIVIVIDELADLMMLAPEDTERSVTRLAQMARATGIHMVIATQRPSVDVVTGLIKANFPARIAFAVASGTDSRVILDTTGAERLLGQGDMLFQKPDAPAPLRLQGCFTSDAELGRLIAYWQTARRQNLISKDAAQPKGTAQPGGAAQPESAAQSDSAVTETRGQTTTTSSQTPAASPGAANGSSSDRQTTPAATENPTETKPATNNSASSNRKKTQKSPPDKTSTKSTKSTQASAPELPPQQPLWKALQEEAQKPEYADELMPEAIAMVRKLNKASTSLLQRRFRIGYTRAARMIDAMAEQGIIGPPTGTSKARTVYPAGDGEETPVAEGEESSD